MTKREREREREREIKEFGTASSKTF